jgi:hypothetical protein
MTKYEKIKIFLLGVLVAIAAILLLGAAQNYGKGRFRYGGETGSDNTTLILDSATGTLYHVNFGESGEWAGILSKVSLTKKAKSYREEK